jgi:O-antigen ligase
MNLLRPSLTEYSLKILLVASLLSIYINQAPHNAILFFSFLVSLIYLAQNTKYLILFLSRFKTFYLFLACYSIFYISTNIYHFGYNEDLLYAMQRIRWILYIFVILPAFVIFLSLNKTYPPKTLRTFYILLCVVSTVVISDSFLRYFFDNNILAKLAGSSHLGLTRPGWVYNPILFAKISFFTSLIFSIFYANSDEKIKKYLSLFFMVLTLIACLLTEVRGAWLGILALGILAILFIRQLRIIAALTLTSIICAFISLPESHLSKRVSAAINTSSYSEQYRLAHWQANFKLTLENPFLGIGYSSNTKPGALSPHLKKGISHGQPHNEYIDIMAASGFIGLLLFLGVLFTPSFYIIKLMNQSEGKLKTTLWISLAFQIFMFITIMFDRLSSIGWTCLLYSWLPTFWVILTQKTHGKTPQSPQW